MELRGPVWLAVLLLAASPGLAGCIGSPSESDGPAGGAGEARTDRAPLVPIPAEVNGLEHRAHLEAEQGFDADANGSIAYVAARSGFYTVDVSDPGAPEQLAVVQEAGSRYVQLIDQGERLVAAASGANQEVLHLLDVTDPERPELLSSFDPGRTVHNVAVIPGTSMLYNPRGVGDPVEPGIDIIDASDPSNPEVVERWAFPQQANDQPVRTAGCGMITYQIEDDIAYCPAVSQTYILDISDRLDPEVVSVISNPAINVHHWTQEMDDGEVLLIADWAAAGNTPTCRRAPTDQVDSSPPPGAVWAYDISDPEDPQPMDFVDVEAPEGVGPDEQCSPHVVEAVPGHDRVVVGWHRAGVVLLDTSDPTDLQVADHWSSDGNAWSVHVHGGLVLAPDRDAGLDVIELTG